MDDLETMSGIAEKLDKAASKLNRKALDKVEDAAQNVAKSFSGSWLGYHSRVYYENLEQPPAGARFDADWGFGERMSSETRGRWGEFPFDLVVEAIMEAAGKPNTEKLQAAADVALNAFEEAQGALLSILSRYKTSFPDDEFLETLFKKISGEKNVSYSGLVAMFRPRSYHTHDTVAAHQGVLTPPHFHVIAQLGTWRHPFRMCEDLAKMARQAASHVGCLEKKSKRTSLKGTHVFIGHGRSPVWKDFRDFIRDRVKLPYDEFNRVPVAGIPTSTRLMQMLDDAVIAFLILTAEDEQADGKYHPRMNVIHEAGLFQGRLGLARAIILLEEGCQEFSNSHGVGYIKFPKGDISQAYEDVRRVLEREELIETPKP